MILGMLDMCLLERRNIPTVQWGFSDGSNVVFPVQFSTEGFALAGIQQDDGKAIPDAITYQNLTTSGFLLVLNANEPTKYIAIGQ